MAFLMQAVSNSDGLLYSWESAVPEFGGLGFPGPGTAAHVCVVATTSVGTKNAIRDHDATNSPLAHWTLSEVLTDSSGNGLNLTVAAGSAIYTDIFPGKRALQLQQATRLYYNTAASTLERTGDITISMLLSMSELTADRFLVSFGGGAGTQATNILYSISLTTNGAPRWIQEHGAGVTTDGIHSAAGFVMPVGLCHFAATRASNVIQFYLNGRTLGSASATLTAADGGTSSRFFVGNEAGSFSASAIIRSLCVFGSALTATQVKAQYNYTMGDAFGLAA